MPRLLPRGNLSFSSMNRRTCRRISLRPNPRAFHRVSARLRRPLRYSHSIHPSRKRQHQHRRRRLPQRASQIRSLMVRSGGERQGAAVPQRGITEGAKMIRLVFSFSSPLPRACSRRPLAGVRIYRSRLATAATTHCGGLRNLTNRASVRQYRRRPRESFPPGRGGVGEHESYPAVLSHFASSCRVGGIRGPSRVIPYASFSRTWPSPPRGWARIHAPRGVCGEQF
jgi:hypothetical protein